jgi:hypothetical protein
MKPCVLMAKRKDERAVWLWHPDPKPNISPSIQARQPNAVADAAVAVAVAGSEGDQDGVSGGRGGGGSGGRGGIFRPSFTRTSNVYCLAAFFGASPNAEAVALRLETCNLEKPSQRWVVSAIASAPVGVVELRNGAHPQLCMRHGASPPGWLVTLPIPVASVSFQLLAVVKV